MRFDTDGHEDLKSMRGGEGDLEEEEFNPLVAQLVKHLLSTNIIRDQSLLVALTVRDFGECVYMGV